MKPGGRVSSSLDSSSSSAHLLLQHAHQPDNVSNSVSAEQTLAKLHQLESSHTQLLKQLAATSITLHERTLGFEAMTVLVRHLSEKVTGCQ